jgi:hypothetical protein
MKRRVKNDNPIGNSHSAPRCNVELPNNTTTDANTSQRISHPRGWLKYGNPPGDPNAAPRCGARTRRGTACQCPAIRGKWRCRLHGGRSTGPKTLEGLQRLRAAKTTTGRFSAVELLVEGWRRRWFRNGYRSLRALGPGTETAQGYYRQVLAKEEAEGIAPALVEEQRREARATVTARDVARLRAKGFLKD